MRVYFFMFKMYRGLIIYLINAKSLQHPGGFVPLNPHRAFPLAPPDAGPKSIISHE